MPTAAKKTDTTVDVKELLKAGAHFGHKTSHWNPSMQPYIYGRRGNIYIIDLVKTAADLEKALAFVQEVAADGKDILYVGTKRHLRPAVKAAAQAAGMPYVTNRWLGGTLTNFETIHKRITYLRKLEEQLESGELKETYNKREILEFSTKAEKLRETLSGIRDMDKLPAAVFVASAKTDQIAIRESSRLGIPVIAVVDTNADPEPVDYVIAANDDAVSTVELVGKYLAQAVQSGKKAGTRPQRSAKADAGVPTEAPGKVNSKERTTSEEQ